MKSSNELRIGIVLVSYGHHDVIDALLQELRRQMKSGDQIVIVDQHATKATFQRVSPDHNTQVIARQNMGFGSGCNAAVKLFQGKVDVIFLLNPDVMPHDSVLDAIRGLDWDVYAACMPLLLLTDGKINSAGNIVHTTGLSWCDKIYQPRAAAKNIKEVSMLSGACLAVRTEWWNKLGGMDENYFMYYEDTDFCSRITSMGGKMALLPKVYAEHDYEFIKGSHKWLYLERNIPLYILKNWPLSIIIIFLPQNIMAWAGLWLVALMQGRLGLKFKSLVMTIKAIPTFLESRRVVRSQRTISDFEYLQTLSPTIDTPIAGKPLTNPLLNAIFQWNYNLASLLLKPRR